MKTQMITSLRKLTAIAGLTCASLLAAPSSHAAALVTVYSNDFQSYATGGYAFPSIPLPGWTGMTSQSGLQSAIVSPPVTGTGQALNVDALGGGGIAWMSVASPVLAGSTSDWSVSANARYLASNNPGSQPWYAWGGLLLSSTGDLSGDYLALRIDVGWGEYDTNVAWARPIAAWSLGGVSGGGVIYPWAPPAGVTNVVGNALRMSSDATYGPAGLTLSRTGGASTISYNINTPTDGPSSGNLTFSGAEAAALDNLQYVGFTQYYNKWEYDNLVVQAVPEPSTFAMLLGGAGMLVMVMFRRRCGRA